MLKRYALLASALVLVGVASFVAGRATARPPLLQAEARQEQKQASKATAQVDASSVASSVAAAVATGKERIVVKWRRAPAAPPPPGCPPCIEEGERVEDKNETKSTVASETKNETQHQTASVRTVHTEQTRVVEAEKPRWMVGLLGGLDLSGSRHWGGMVSARVAGPFEVGLAVVPSVRAGFAVVGVRW